MHPSKTLDVKGLLCPIPVFRAKKAINDIPPGELLEILATDPTTKSDIPTWAQREGHRVEAMEEAEGVIRFLVRRTP